MEQVLVKKRLPELRYELVETLMLERLQQEEETFKEVSLPKEKNLPKKVLLKVFNKAKYNAKYLEELIPIDKAKQQGLYRNFGIF